MRSKKKPALTDSICTYVYGFDCGGDIMLCDGLVRSVMLKSVLKGIDSMFFALPENADISALCKLRFISEDSRLCTELESFMGHCSDCKG